MFLTLLVPVHTHAEVRITEVAWMGDADSASNEWIELYNDGASVSVDGWTLQDDTSLSVSLSGTIDANTYAVLERTDDDSAVGPAFNLYSGALSNVGTTLSLYRTNGSLENRVIGGDAWGNIGGNNSTKETAQYINGSWVTAVATPGSGETEVIEDQSVQDETDDKEPVQKKDSADKQSSVSTLHVEPREAQTTIDAPTQVYVHQAVPLVASSEGLADGIVRSMAYSWNFGDLGTAVGDKVQHRFMYPGEYVVHVHAQYKEYETHTRTNIVVLPVSFTLSTSSAGDIQIRNDAPHEIDISGYRVTAGKTVRFPEGTTVLPGARITIPKEKIEYVQGGRVVLSDQLLATIMEIPTQQFLVYTNRVTTPSVPHTFVKAPVTQEKTTLGTSSSLSTAAVIEEGISSSQIAATSAPDTPRTFVPYVGLFGVLSLGVASVFSGRFRRRVDPRD